jgi:serine/threonine protein kinase
MLLWGVEDLAPMIPGPPRSSSFLPDCDPTLPSRSGLSEAARLLDAGTLIGNVYRVKHRLGSGAMGTVLLAHDEVLDRNVALKFVREHLLDELFRARFVTEARAMARVSHPNVVQIHAFGEHCGLPYFVMEFVEGTTLDVWLSEHPAPLPLALCRELLNGICNGVSAIHDTHALHRDLKPSNVLIHPDLRPRVADLGLALLCSAEKAMPSEVVGTPAYMAPEIFLGAPIAAEFGTRADVYSLGCIAYEILTGRQPYPSSSGKNLPNQHLNAPVPSLREARTDLSEEFDHVVQRALAKDPAERTPSAETFRREIARACDGASDPVSILVAEDNEDFREALDETLKRAFAGAEIECVADGYAALEAFDRRRPSVAILDFRMPGLDGMQLTRLFRARSESSGIPIVVLTASGGSEEWQEFRAQGADRMLVKPVVLDDVVALIKRVLRERHPESANLPPAKAAG